MVPLHEGRPVVSAAGDVALWHARCWAARDVPLVDEPVALAAPRRVRGRHVAVASGAAVVALALVVCPKLVAGSPPSASLSAVDLDDGDDAGALGDHVGATAREALPVTGRQIDTPLEHRYPRPTIDAVPVDVSFPSLQGWVHPVTASAELMPEQYSRHFGAERRGIERPECGAGHCGVDLDGPRGRPIVAVADGVVVRVERHELGLDGRSGRYVRIQHDDGTLTAYMHLDDVAEEIEPGDRVRAGEYLGTLGASAVYDAPPHLHFSIEVPNDPSQRGDTTNTHYIDPAPFLVRAHIVAAPDRRHARKPAT